RASLLVGRAARRRALAHARAARPPLRARHGAAARGGARLPVARVRRPAADRVHAELARVGPARARLRAGVLPPEPRALPLRAPRRSSGVPVPPLRHVRPVDLLDEPVLPRRVASALALRLGEAAPPGGGGDVRLLLLLLVERVRAVRDALHAGPLSAARPARVRGVHATFAGMAARARLARRRGGCDQPLRRLRDAARPALGRQRSHSDAFPGRATRNALRTDRPAPRLRRPRGRGLSLRGLRLQGRAERGRAVPPRPRSRARIRLPRGAALLRHQRLLHPLPERARARGRRAGRARVGPVLPPSLLASL